MACTSRRAARARAGCGLRFAGAGRGQAHGEAEGRAERGSSGARTSGIAPGGRRADSGQATPGTAVPARPSCCVGQVMPAGTSAQGRTLMVVTTTKEECLIPESAVPIADEYGAAGFDHDQLVARDEQGQPVRHRPRSAAAGRRESRDVEYDQALRRVVELGHVRGRARARSWLLSRRRATRPARGRQRRSDVRLRSGGDSAHRTARGVSRRWLARRGARSLLGAHRRIAGQFRAPGNARVGRGRAGPGRAFGCERALRRAARRSSGAGRACWNRASGGPWAACTSLRQGACWTPRRQRRSAQSSPERSPHA